MPKYSVVFFASHAHGGIRELWANLAEGFHENGQDSGLTGLYPLPGSLEPPTNILAWDYILPKRPSGLGGKIRLAWGLTRWLRRTQPDVIISSMPAANVLAALFCRIFSPRTTVIISHHSPANVYRPLLNFLDRITGSFSNVKAIVSVSASVDKTLASRPPAYRAKCLVIHNAVPPYIEQMLTSLRERGLERIPGRTVTVSGRLEAQKNHPMLIRATALMKDVRVEILGNGPDKDALCALMRRLGVTDTIELLGNRNRNEALQIISTGDVFVQVSLFEGHSLALIEAAKLGLPLIVSNVPSQVEAITARDGTICGLLVDLDDYAGLARAVHQVLDSTEERARLSALALKLAAECTFAHMMAQYQHLIEQHSAVAIMPAQPTSSAVTETTH